MIPIFAFLHSLAKLVFIQGVHVDVTKTGLDTRCGCDSNFCISAFIKLVFIHGVDMIPILHFCIFAFSRF